MSLPSDVQKYDIRKNDIMNAGFLLQFTMALHDINTKDLRKP